MTPDEGPDRDGPTKPLPVDPESSATEPMVAPHVPVADVSTAPLGPVAVARTGRSRALMGVLIAAVVLLGITLIVFLTMYFQGQPTPALTPSPLPSTSPTVTTPPTEPAPVDEPSEEPEPEPEPTTPPEPTDPPDPDPTETPIVPVP